ncbi:hypothetical protein DV735_g664, partial [Chaetothyriales sp. CBS 134920]
MDERKRPISHENDLGPPLKKQATAANGASKPHPDDAMPWKDDLEVSPPPNAFPGHALITPSWQRFQKDAIHRQMLEYKREKNTLESQLKELRKKARYHDDHLRAIDAWFKQLIDEVKTLVSASDEDEELQLQSLPSSLFFADQSTFEEHLSARSNDIRTIISRLFSRTQSFTPEVVELQKRISQLLAAEKAHAAKLEQSQKDRDELEERLENATMRYISAEKKIDRAKSTTVAKLEKQALLGATKRDVDDALSVKKEESAVNGTTDHSEELAEMEMQFNKASATSEKQKLHIEKLQEENAKLQSHITSLQSKSASLTDDDYAKTDLFKRVKLQYEDVVKRLNDLEARNLQLKQENQNFLSERTVYANQLDAETRATIAEKDQAIAQAENNLARIRAERDEHMAKRDILQKTLDSDKNALKKIQELYTALEERAKSLELENQRLSEQSRGSPKTSDLDNLAAEDLRTRYHELDRRYGLLNGELTSMQSAYQKMSKLAGTKVAEFTALEEKLQRLSAEKQKADQKYFATMKSKETREGEVRMLKLQANKSSEVVNALRESEATARGLVANCDKQLAEAKEALTRKMNELRAAQLEKQTKELELGRLSSQVNELKQQLASRDSHLAAASSSCRAAETELAELQATLKDTRRSLESWKSKSGQSEMHESLRQLAYCNICKKSLKDTVIKTCGHTFCHDCVDERLTSRSRKCPNCGKSFGANDHMKITL